MRLGCCPGTRLFASGQHPGQAPGVPSTGVRTRGKKGEATELGLGVENVPILVTRDERNDLRTASGRTRRRERLPELRGGGEHRRAASADWGD